MTILEALETALSTLELEGYQSGDIHDDLVIVIRRLRNEYPSFAKEEL